MEKIKIIHGYSEQKKSQKSAVNVKVLSGKSKNNMEDYFKNRVSRYSIERAQKIKARRSEKIWSWVIFLITLVMTVHFGYHIYYYVKLAGYLY